DPLGVGWNVTQAKIAIGSGRLQGKGFLEGTQTKFDFVPEQSTDFIFCTIGEEHGFIGSLVVIALFIGLITRLVILAEKQRSKFARVYGYCVAGIIFFHVMINIGMTIGLMPVIGIPLPFFSYGGSSLWSFSILLFIFLKLDSRRTALMRR
ncbi:MAG TPA: rod shape-determining protein RodA, partial [Spirosoma sp.]|nr:rod shape-determining protein RodA [Spirosoma sp.]